jgi:phosphoribosyl 1,2-cyclic phosphodiesterase
MKLTFCSLSSGSSGNCYYIGNEFHGLLVDAGISATSIKKFLKEQNISLQAIMGVLITHNHSDHIKGLEVLTRRNHIPAFTTANVWKSVRDAGCEVTSDCIRTIPLMSIFRIAGFDIEAFPVCHDAPETIGFHICHEGKSLTVVTDLGHICDTSASYIKKANLLVIESNYDEEMLTTGGYPYYLKKRIKSDHGHLGNHQTAEFLAECMNEKLSHICLAHLSKNNNTPEKALGTLKRILREKCISWNERSVSVLSRNVPSDVIVLSSE